MKITILYNNESKNGLKSGWGFSCLIEAEKMILFDTGCEGPGLLRNIKKLGFDVKDIDVVVLSHHHWDHTGGLFNVLDSNNGLEVYVLSSFSEHFKGEIKKRAKLKEIEDEQEICKNIYTTGLIKNNPDEQSLILKTAKGIIVVVGCSHPSVNRILEIAKKYGNIYAIVGGFHDFSDLDSLKGIEVLGVCHCTKYTREIKERFPEQFKEIKAGDVIE